MNIPISILLGLIFTMLTGTIAYLAFSIIRKINKNTNVLKTQYILLKIVILAFVIPICFLWETSLHYEQGLLTNSLFVATPTLRMISIAILCAWFFGMIIQIFIWIRSAVIYRLSLKLYKETKEHDKLIGEVKKELNIQKDIKVSKGEYYHSPFYTGLITPRICLPMIEFTNSELEYIFMHELIHYKHRDVLFMSVIRILEVVYWFHPIFCNGKMLLQYRELMEDACDIDVCSKTKEYKEYISVLVRMVLRNECINHKIPVFLSESYLDVIRRAGNMEKYMKQNPIKRLLIAMLVGVVFCGSSLVVYAADKGVAAGYERAYDATWEGLEEEMNGNTENTLTEVYELAEENPSINVEYTDDGSVAYANSYNVNYTISAHTEKRKSVAHLLQPGDKVLVSVSVDPADKNVKVGFYMSNGYVRYITGSGDIYHTFTVYDADSYYFFVQNNNSANVEVVGYYSIR